MEFCLCRVGDFQQSFGLVEEALEVYPGHKDSEELLRELRKHFQLL